MKLFIIALLLVVQIQEKSQKEYDLMIQNAINDLNNNEFTRSLELLIEVEKIASQKGWHREHFLAVNNKGANYYKMSDYGEALTNYLEAYEIAIKHLDANSEMVVLNNIGILFYQEDKLNEAESYFFKAYQIARDNNNAYRKGLYAVNLGLVLNKSLRLEEAEAYINIAIPLLEAHQNILVQAKYAYGENLFLKNKYSEAESYFKSLIPELNSVEFINQKAMSYLMLSRISLKNGNLTAAIAYAIKAKDQNNSLESQIDISMRLSDLYYENKNFTLSRQYRDSTLILKDSLYVVKSNDRFESNRVKLDIKNYERELLLSQQTLQAERKLFYSLLGGAGAILLVLAWAWRNNIIKYKQKKIIEERNQKIKMLELESELEAKNRKLAVKATTISSRNELMSEIIENIKNQPDLYANAKLRRYINQISKHIKSETEWNDFFTHFEEANHGFITALKTKHPELSANDIRFVSYLYMNLSIKEMASLLNITPDACRKRKERISKKMGCQETAELYQYLFTL